MNPIQIVLMAGLAISFLLYWKLFQNRFLNRLMLIFGFAVMVVFVVKPDLSTAIANKLGVGRGVDLIFYLAILAVLFVLVMMYAKIKKLEEMIIQIHRRETLKDSDA